MKNVASSISLSEKNLEIQENKYVKTRDVESISHIVEQVIESENIIGSIPDFHNLAVDLAALNLHELACEILKRGIKIHNNSVDLYADYLLYGRDFEGSRESSEKYYEILKSIDDRFWTWRGYAFSLEYLKSKLFRTNDHEVIAKIEEDINQIIQAYYAKLPDDELPYFAEANLYRGIEPEKESKVLAKALSQLKSHPRCTIRYVDLLLSKSGDINAYKKAAEDLEFAKLQINEDLDFGYAQFLRGLCLIRLLNNEDYKNKEKIEEIYQCFRIAQIEELRVKGSDISFLKKQIRMLETLSNTKYEET